MIGRRRFMAGNATSRSCSTTYRGDGRDASGGYATVGLRVAATAKA